MSAIIETDVGQNKYVLIPCRLIHNMETLLLLIDTGKYSLVKTASTEIYYLTLSC